MKVLEPYKLGPMTLKNRLVMPPMCMYSAKEDGMANDFHFTHYETRAVGGVGLVILEATGVTSAGRISDRDLGIWSDDHVSALKQVADKIKKHGSVAGIQLAHAGRKCEVISEAPVAPSAIRFNEKMRVPEALSLDGIDGVVKAFVDGARRALEAGFDFIEIHGAHGYLNHEFLSPLSNHRDDLYGGSLENRCRLLNRIIAGIREVLPKQGVLALRVSASDYADGGIDCDEMVRIIDEVKEGIDIVHVSSAALVPVRLSVYPGYQIQFAEQIKKECQIPTIAVGLITTTEMMEEVLHNNRADLIATGRLLLRQPYFPLNLYKEADMMEMVPDAYARGF